MKRFFLASLLLLAMVVTSWGHIHQGEGAGLQLYSYQMMGIAPKIDGTIDGAWGSASLREIILNDRTSAHVWFMNNKEYLYVAVRYAHADEGNGNGLILYFDEGGNTGLMVEDGQHDDEIVMPEKGARNEDAVAVSLVSGKAKQKNLSWDGKGWKEDKIPTAGLETAGSYKKGMYCWEFKIPLDNINDDNRNGSDLDVSSTDELGFLIEVIKDGEGKGSWYWQQTNLQPGNAAQGAGWADLQLGFNTQVTTLYATMALAGAPTVDGNIDAGSTPDKAWQGAFSHDINLTNFQGTRHRATVQFLDVVATKALYAGIKVYDRTENSGDYCELYQEENDIVPTAGRNMVLDAGLENGIRAAKRSGTDLGWDGTAWKEDTDTPNNQPASGLFYPLRGIPHYEYEYTLLKNGGSNDLQLKEGAGIGLLIHYHDADMPAGKQDFYWEYTTNCLGIVADSAALGLASGWALLQSGAPSFQVVSPEDNATVGGGYVLRVYAGARAGRKPIAKVEYKIKGEESWKALNQVAGSNEWTVVWKTDAKPDGEYTVLFAGRDGLGNPLVTRAVHVEIKNTRTVSLNPIVKIATPRASEIVYGASYIINFQSKAVAARTIVSTQFSIDGGPWSLTTSATAHHWNTMGLPDGSHFIRIRATDSEGDAGVSVPVLILLDNTAPVAALTIAPARVKDGEVLTFTVNTMVPGLSVVIPRDQLKIIDSGVSGDLVLKDEQGNGCYRATHTLSKSNNSVDGNKKITCRLRDVQGNVYNAPAQIVLDNTPPSIIAFTCGDADNIYRNGSAIRVGITCDAPHYTYRVNFSNIDNAYASGNVALVVAGNGAQATYTIAEENTLASAEYTITVTVEDEVGLTAQKTLALFLDNNGPIITNAKTADKDAILVRADTVLVQAKDTEHAVARLEYFIDVPGVFGAGIELIAGDKGYRAPLALTSLTQGEHTIFMRGRDSAGNDGAVVELPFTVDTKSPEIAHIAVEYLDTNPAADSAQIKITALVHDAVIGVEKMLLHAPDLLTATPVRMEDTGKNGDAVAGDNIYTAIIVPNKKAHGEVSVTLEAFDNVGNKITSAPVQTVMDNTNPIIRSVKVTSPDNIFQRGETVFLTVTTDAAEYRVCADFSAADEGYRYGRAVVQDKGDNTYLVAYPLTIDNQRAEGTYSIVITVSDRSGNSATETVDMVLDTRGPIVKDCVFKDTDAVLATDDMVLVTLKDSQTVVVAAELFIDMVREPGTGRALTPKKGSFGAAEVKATAPVTLAGLAEGTHTVYVRGKDAAGIWGAVFSTPFSIDRCAPVVSNVRITYPLGQTVVCDGQQVCITARVEDAGAGLDTATILLHAGALHSDAKKVVLKDNGKGADVAAHDGIFSAAVTIRNGKSGAMAITIGASDRVPLAAVKVQSTVMVDNTNPIIKSVIDTDSDHVYMRGQTIHLVAVLDDTGYTVTADFSALDDQYIPGSEVVVVTGDTATIAYRIHPDNRREGKSYVVSLTVFDVVGLQGKDKIKLTLDTTGPVVTLKLADADKVLNDSTTITVKVKDTEQDIARIWYALDVIPTAGIALPVDLKKGEIVLNPAGLTQGLHTVYVQAQNVSGQWGACAQQTFTVDTQAPLVSAVQVVYSQNRTLAGAGMPLIITVAVVDAGVGLNTEKLVLNASAFGGGKKEILTDDGKNGDGVAGDNVYTATITVKAKEGGIKPFTLTCTDNVPNVLQLQGTVMIDPRAPSLIITTDKLAEKLKGKVAEAGILVQGTYTDDDVVTISLAHTVEGKSLSGMPRAIPVVSSKDFIVPLTLLPGVNRIEVVAGDRAGNITTITATVTYEIPEVKEAK